MLRMMQTSRDVYKRQDILRAANQDGADCVLMDWLETFPVKGEQDEGKEEDIDWEKIQEESGKQLLDCLLYTSRCV